MRILISPDSFGGTLSALEASQAMSRGWQQAFPDNEIRLLPLSDGGPGFLETLGSALGGILHSIQVPNAFGEMKDVQWMQIGSAAYIEVSQICGIDQSPRTPQSALSASSIGVGVALRDVAENAEISEINLGLGGTCVTDGGAGLFFGLGATSDVDLLNGGQALVDLRHIDISQPIEKLAKLKINYWSDVDVPLLGKRGAAQGFAPQKGAGAAEIETLESGLQNLAEKLGRTSAGKNPALSLGAGAAGGIGFALEWLGAERLPGIAQVMKIVDFEAAANWADLILTGEGKLDWQSEVGKVITGVTEIARSQAVPVLALVGQNDLSLRELQNLGVHGVYSMVELFGEEESLTRARQTLERMTRRAARTWGRN